ncbi:ATP-binding protein [Escherichia coli]|nr:ATP-binding protein [Escherichia coli]
MARKISTLDKIFKSSGNKNVILKKAFKELEPKTLQTFSKIMYKKFPFNNVTSIGEAIENRTIYEFKIFIPEPVKSASNNVLFHYVIGILNRNQNSISKLISLEKKYIDSLLFDKPKDALDILDEIDSSFGLSFWSITQRNNIEYLMYGEVRIGDETKNYNDVDDILIKIHQNNLNEINDGILIAPEIIDSEALKNGIYSFINYRIFGLNSSDITFDIFQVIKHELSSTLVDLYKAFETLCYMTITGIYSGYEPYYDDILKYISSIDHYLFRNLNSNEDLSEEAQLIYDSYTLNDYAVTINLLSKTKEFDPSRFKIFTKSLSLTDTKLPEECFYFLQSNLMSDVYSKNEKFQHSSTRLSNLNLAFRGTLVFNLIKHRINIESKGYYNEKESYIIKAELLFSKDNTPLKSIILSNRAQGSNSYKLKGVTADIFMKKEEPHDIHHNERRLKYFIFQLMNENKVSEASNYLVDKVTYKDKELSQLYIKIKSMAGRIEDACRCFLDMYKISPSAINYFITEEFYSALESSAKNATNIDTAICLYLCKDSFVDKKMNINATGIAIGKSIRYMGLKHPSELPIDKADGMLSFYLSDVCEKDILTKSWLYRTQSEAYDERIRICNILVSNKMGNQDKLVNESKILSKRKVLEVAEKQVNSTKIYADKDYILNNIWEQLNFLFKDIVEKRSEFGDILDSEIERVLKNLDLEKVDISTVTNMGLNILPVHILQYAALGQNYKLKAIFQMIKTYIEEYCFGLKGLNTYLSTRIRHGTLESTITSSLVSNGFMPADDNDEDRQFYNLLKDTPEDLIAQLKRKRNEFKEKLYFIINEIINDWLQISIDSPIPTKQKFNFYFDEYDLIRITKKIELSQSFNECCGYLDEFIEDKLASSCLRVISSLDNKSRTDILALFDDFEDFLYEIQRESGCSVSYEFNRLVTISKQHVLNQLDVIINWFKLKQDFHEESYDMEIITGIIKNMVQIENIKVIDNNKIKIKYDILSAIVDIVYNLVNNAIKYSLLHPSNVNIEIECIADKTTNKVSIEVRNDCLAVCNYEEKNQELIKYSAPVSSENLRSLMQREGGNTGIARVKSAIRYELNAREEVTLRYLSENNFSATASFRNAKGLIYD